MPQVFAVCSARQLCWRRFAPTCWRLNQIKPEPVRYVRFRRIMETAPFTPSKVSCSAGMNTRRRISCSEIFLQISVGWQQLSRADGLRRTAEKPCKFQVRDLRLKYLDRQRASGADILSKASKTSPAVWSEERQILSITNAARPIARRAARIRSRKISQHEQNSVAVWSEATNFVENECREARVRAERLASGAEKFLNAAKSHSGVERIATQKQMKRPSGNRTAFSFKGE